MVRGRPLVALGFYEYIVNSLDSSSGTLRHYMGKEDIAWSQRVIMHSTCLYSLEWYFFRGLPIESLKIDENGRTKRT